MLKSEIIAPHTVTPDANDITPRGEIFMAGIAVGAAFMLLVMITFIVLVISKSPRITKINVCKPDAGLLQEVR